MITAFILIGVPIIFTAVYGVRHDLSLLALFVRFAVMLLLLKAFDILFFDYYLLCRSNFYPHYYPETKEVLGPHLFGFNKKSHIIQGVLCVVGSLALAFICTLF